LSFLCDYFSNLLAISLLDEMDIIRLLNAGCIYLVYRFIVDNLLGTVPSVALIKEKGAAISLPPLFTETAG